MQLPEDEQDGPPGALGTEAASAIGQAIRQLPKAKAGVPFADLIALAEGVEGHPLRIDFASAAVIGVPILVLREARADLLGSLTPREREVARLIARGLTNHQISKSLGISVLTVKDHVHNALSKCGFASRAALAAAITWGESKRRCSRRTIHRRMDIGTAGPVRGNTPAE